MRWRRKRPSPTVRQRLKSDEKPIPVNKTFSYRSRRSDTELNTGRITQREELQAAAKQKLQFWLQRLGLIILLIALVASAVNVLTLSTVPRIVPLESAQSGAFLRDLGTYEAASQTLLADSFWNRNKITVNSTKVRDQLLAKFPELASVSVTVPLLAHRPIIYVEPARPALILTSTKGAFVVASSGKALLQAGKVEELSQFQLPIIVHDHSGLEIRLNRQAVPAKEVAFMETITTQLAAKQFKVAEMSLPPATSQLDVRLEGQPYTIKFNLQKADRARQQAGVFLATIANLQKSGTTPAQYVDVRVEGRAYYQ